MAEHPLQKPLWDLEWKIQFATEWAEHMDEQAALEWRKVAELERQLTEMLVEIVGAENGTGPRLMDLDIGVRPWNNLQRNGIKTVDALVAMTEKDLAGIPNMGKVSLEEIKHALAQYGLSLREA